MKSLKTILLIFFFIFLSSTLFTSSTDFNQDLGRHLKLGKIIINNLQVPKTNFFSYTHPSFPFINHHWLSEVIFYLLSSLFGLTFLIYLKVFLILISILIVIKLSNQKSAIITALLFIPFLINRSDIRPEIFGYFFFSVVLYITLKYPKNKTPKTKAIDPNSISQWGKLIQFFALVRDRFLIYFLPLIMLLWINLHISFVFGIFLILLFFLKIIYLKLTNDHLKKLKTFKTELLIIIFSLGVLFLNPNGIKGVLYPFKIFNNYGYSIVENQNLLFLNKALFNPLIKYFFILSPITIISFLYLLLINQIIEAVILAIFFLISIWQIRHWPFFTLTAIPLISPFLNRVFQLLGKKYKQVFTFSSGFYLLGIGIITILTIIFTSNFYYKTFDINKQFGLGFNKDYKKGSLFIQKNKLEKNIFNNFDIGGYLIYKLYPKYKLFVDNRPEAYPADFLQNTYIKLQENKELRKKVFQKYKIKTIVFSHTDQTPWGIDFIRQIYQDSSWKLIYLDKALMILSKKTTLADIRNNNNYFQNLIDKEKNYLALVKLNRIFQLFDKQKLADLAIKKAQRINPSSCIVKKIYINNYLKKEEFYFRKIGLELRKKYSYCY